jgi:hypothetical protein
MPDKGDDEPWLIQREFAETQALKSTLVDRSGSDAEDLGGFTF